MRRQPLVRTRFVVIWISFDAAGGNHLSFDYYDMVVDVNSEQSYDFVKAALVRNGGVV